MHNLRTSNEPSFVTLQTFNKHLQHLTSAKFLATNSKGKLIPLFTNIFQTSSNATVTRFKLMAFLVANQSFLHSPEHVRQITKLAKMAGLATGRSESIEKHPELNKLLKLIYDKMVTNKPLKYEECLPLFEDYRKKWSKNLNSHATEVSQVIDDIRSLVLQQQHTEKFALPTIIEETASDIEEDEQPGMESNEGDNLSNESQPQTETQSQSNAQQDPLPQFIPQEIQVKNDEPTKQIELPKEPCLVVEAPAEVAQSTPIENITVPETTVEEPKPETVVMETVVVQPQAQDEVQSFNVPAQTTKRDFIASVIAHLENIGNRALGSVKDTHAFFYQRLLNKPFNAKNADHLEKWIFYDFLKKAEGIPTTDIDQTRSLLNPTKLVEKLGLKNAIALLVAGYQMAYHLTDVGNDSERKLSHNSSKLYRQALRHLEKMHPQEYQQVQLDKLTFDATQVSTKFIKSLKKAAFKEKCWSISKVALFLIGALGVSYGAFNIKGRLTTGENVDITQKLPEIPQQAPKPIPTQQLFPIDIGFPANEVTPPQGIELITPQLVEEAPETYQEIGSLQETILPIEETPIEIEQEIIVEEAHKPVEDQITTPNEENVVEEQIKAPEESEEYTPTEIENLDEPISQPNITDSELNAQSEEESVQTQHTPSPNTQTPLVNSWTFGGAISLAFAVIAFAFRNKIRKVFDNTVDRMLPHLQIDIVNTAKDPAFNRPLKDEKVRDESPKSSEDEIQNENPSLNQARKARKRNAEQARKDREAAEQARIDREAAEAAAKAAEAAAKAAVDAAGLAEAAAKAAAAATPVKGAAPAAETAAAPTETAAAPVEAPATPARAAEGAGAGAGGSDANSFQSPKSHRRNFSAARPATPVTRRHKQIESEQLTNLHKLFEGRNYGNRAYCKQLKAGLGQFLPKNNETANGAGADGKDEVKAIEKPIDVQETNFDEQERARIAARANPITEFEHLLILFELRETLRNLPENLKSNIINQQIRGIEQLLTPEQMERVIKDSEDTSNLEKILRSILTGINSYSRIELYFLFQKFFFLKMPNQTKVAYWIDHKSKINRDNQEFIHRHMEKTADYQYVASVYEPHMKSWNKIARYIRLQIIEKCNKLIQDDKNNMATAPLEDPPVDNGTGVGLDVDVDEPDFFKESEGTKDEKLKRYPLKPPSKDPNVNRNADAGAGAGAGPGARLLLEQG